MGAAFCSFTTNAETRSYPDQDHRSYYAWEPTVYIAIVSKLPICSIFHLNVHHDQDNSFWFTSYPERQLGLTGVVEKHQVSPNDTRLYKERVGTSTLCDRYEPPNLQKLPVNPMLGNFGTTRNAKLGPPPTLTVALELPFALPQHDYDHAFNAATLLPHQVGRKWTYPMLRITSPPLIQAGCVHHAPFRPNDTALCRNQITPLINSPSSCVEVSYILLFLLGSVSRYSSTSQQVHCLAVGNKQHGITLLFLPVPLDWLPPDAHFLPLRLR